MKNSKYVDEQIAFDGNDVDLLYNYLTENEFNYARSQLAPSFPELVDLVYNPDKTLLEQIATLKGIPLTTLHKKLGLESYYSLLVNKHYEEVVRDLNNPWYPIWKKESITKQPVSWIMFSRMFIVLLLAVLVGFGLPLLIWFFFKWWNVFLIIAIGCALRIRHDWGLAVLHRRFTEWIYNIVTRGG